MFLGLIVASALILTLFVLVLRAVRSLFRRIQGSGKASTESRKEERKKDGDRNESKSEEVSRSENVKPEESLPEETRRRYVESRYGGITEEFSPGTGDFRIDPEDIASRCTERSRLSRLEYTNRDLAGDDFRGFNLLVEDDSRMVLTYSGSAVASLSKTETEATAVINGANVTGTMTGYRINTFPPRLKEGMTVNDVETALKAIEEVKACLGIPEAVSRVMVSCFTHEANVSRLKAAVDGRIQEKESRRMGVDSGMKKGPQRKARL